MAAGSRTKLMVGVDEDAERVESVLASLDAVSGRRDAMLRASAP